MYLSKQETCRADDVVTLRAYAPHNAEDRAVFDRLNRAWLEEYFAVEAIDEAIFADPEGKILAQGGRIFMAEMSGCVVGVGALKKMSREDGLWFEMSKFGVEKGLQGKGIGRKLTTHAIELASAAGATGMIIYSNRLLAPAIHLYQSSGFQEVPMSAEDKALYARGDIKLELVF